MKKPIKTVSVYPNRAPYGWLFRNALPKDDVHFEKLGEAAAKLNELKPRPQAVIVDQSLLTRKHKDEATRLLTACHALGLLVICVADDNGKFIGEGEIARSNLHLYTR